LKREGDTGEGKNFFSREKKFFLAPASLTPIKYSAQHPAADSFLFFTLRQICLQLNRHAKFCVTSLPAGGVGTICADLSASLMFRRRKRRPAFRRWTASG